MPLVHGHRGARAVLPENTLQAFCYAISAGADYVELDVAVTLDDVPVVSHDPILRSGETIRRLSLPQLRRADPSVPTLGEVLTLPGARFNIEMKSSPDEPDYTPPPDGCAALLLECIRRRNLDARVIVQSFDFRILHAMRRQAPEIRLAALVESGEPDFVATTRQARADIIAPEHRMVNRDKVAAAHAAGVEVIPWTANAPSDWTRLVDAGVDGIITDDPAALIAWLRHQGLRQDAIPR